MSKNSSNAKCSRPRSRLDGGYGEALPALAALPRSTLDGGYGEALSALAALPRSTLDGGYGEARGGFDIECFPFSVSASAFLCKSYKCVWLFRRVLKLTIANTFVSILSAIIFPVSYFRLQVQRTIHNSQCLIVTKLTYLEDMEIMVTDMRMYLPLRI